MHFKTMVAVNIAPIVEDEKRNQEIRDMIQKLSDSRSEKLTTCWNGKSAACVAKLLASQAL